MHHPYCLFLWCATILLVVAATSAHAQADPKALLQKQFETLARGDVAGALALYGPPGANDRFFTVRRNSGRISSCLPDRTAFKNKRIRETSPERVGIRWDIS